MNKKLNAKDFILIGVLTALMWIICMILNLLPAPVQKCYSLMVRIRLRIRS